MAFTKEDYYWLAGGGLFAAIGGFMWWKNAQKDKENLIPVDTPGNNTGFEIPANTPKVATPKYNGNTKGTHPPALPMVNPPDTYKYQIGQRVMADGNLQTWEAKKRADNSWMSKLDSKGKAIEKASIESGDLLGEIIWVGITADKRTRYVVKRTGKILVDYHWVVGNVNIKAVEPKLGVVQILSNSKLNTTRVLKRGMYDSPEVEELQRLLGFAIRDKDFGEQTEKALYAKRGVKEITLATF